MIRTNAELKSIIDNARSGSPPWWTGPELENLLKDIIDSMDRVDNTLLTDSTYTVDGPGTYDPAGNTNTLTLPTSYIGRRIRVFRNGTLFTTYTRTSTGILLSGADVWLGTTINGPGFEEKITIVNY